MKISSSGAPLTIFYDGRVKVYEKVTPKEAQAIVLRAAASATYATWPALMKPPLPQQRSSVAAHPLPTQLLTNPKSIHRLPGVRERYWMLPSEQQLIRGGKNLLHFMNHSDIRLLWCSACRAPNSTSKLASNGAIALTQAVSGGALRSKAPHNSGRKFNGVNVNLDAKPELNLLGMKVNLDARPELNLLGEKANMNAKPELNLINLL
ncbi:hypothetical protein IEQ34_015590 [Dendrobium chrysotoxum]|uniref:Tify domain-containing protein n=1 Tax=Dendrobium chrysotoxum TaxID=161865 RepID=A0AAV7GIU3_DENCH|nr:hypothetical protein IEQ34_015590 [Dendrobium chrysotoxum]